MKSDPWAMLDLGKDVLRLGEIVARIEQALTVVPSRVHFCTW
jgi:hypothetical protein